MRRHETFELFTLFPGEEIVQQPCKIDAYKMIAARDAVEVRPKPVFERIEERCVVEARPAGRPFGYGAAQKLHAGLPRAQVPGPWQCIDADFARSEEHTSELQSLRH